jgi:hypothetical protein
MIIDANYIIFLSGESAIRTNNGYTVYAGDNIVAKHVEHDGDMLIITSGNEEFGRTAEYEVPKDSVESVEEI